MKTLLLVAVILGTATSSASAAEYNCRVTRKFDSENTYSPEMLAQWQPSVRIIDNGNTAQIARCVVVEGKVDCNTYDVDRIEVTGRRGADPTWNKTAIKKYYNFASNFDVQLFFDTPGLSFIENNGRGAIGYGNCTKIQ